MASMHAPASSNERIRKICLWIVKNTDSILWRHLFSPIFLGLIPALTILFLTKEKLSNDLKAVTGVDLVNNNYALILIGLPLILPILAKALGAAIEVYSKPEKELERNDLLLLLASIRAVVGEKLDRFTDAAKNAKRLHKTAGQVFLEITQPDRQIRQLTRSAYAIFEALDASTEYRVGLLKIVQGKPVEWVAYFPEGRVPRMKPKDLAAETSTVSRCIEKKKIIVIDDIQKEIKKKSKADRNYVAGFIEKGEAGAQICYPIFDTVSQEVSYVLTVAGRKNGCLKANRYAIYEWIIEQIATRIQLEHCLKVIKESVCEKGSGEESHEKAIA